MKSPVEKKNNEGFTLIELVVSMLCVGVVTFAVFTLSYSGVRVGKISSETAERQQTVRIVLSLAEKLAASGSIKSVEKIEAAGEDGGWILWGSEGEAGGEGGGETQKQLLSYHAGLKLLSAAGVPVLKDVGSASAGLSEVPEAPEAPGTPGKQLLTISLSTGGKRYESAVYCRINPRSEVKNNTNVLPSETGNAPDGMTQTEYDARYNFLSLLCTQAGSSGKVQNPKVQDPENPSQTIDYAPNWNFNPETNPQSEEYYSQWYVNTLSDNTWGDNTWNKDTPWCACFISWALAQRKGDIVEDPPKFANVQAGYDAWPDPDDKRVLVRGADETVIPVPGDLIFFDFEKDGTPGHVGAVLYADVSKNSVYTIEGNSAGRVRLHIYSLTDPSILAYGQINWKTHPAQP